MLPVPPAAEAVAVPLSDSQLELVAVAVTERLDPV